jgi:hypothetical protein
MHISSAAPNGIITNLNLGSLPSWRLEIMGNAKGRLGIGLRYVIPPTTTVAFIVALDTHAVNGEALQIAEKGITRGNKIEDKEVFIESLGMLNNAEGVKQKEIDEILKTAPDLIDVYYDILDALQSGVKKSGSFLDYRWNIRPLVTGLELIKEEKTAAAPTKKKTPEKTEDASIESEETKTDDESP